jgi:hypothetical protein
MGQRVVTDRETTQSSREAVAYWATGLEPIYLEGALKRVHHVAIKAALLSAAGIRPSHCASPQNAQASERACNGLRQFQQNPRLGTSRALRRLRMSSSSVAL